MESKKQIFTLPEKKRFLEILKNYSRVVENKHTHSSALKVKNLAWQKITSEFNSSPQTNLQRTPKQLRRLWMNLKHRQREVVARTLHPLSTRRAMDDIISESNMDVAHVLITGVDSSIDSDIVLAETFTNDDPEQLETSLCLSEESQNISNHEIPVFSTVKIESVSPINANPADTTETLTPILNRVVTPNNKTQIMKQQDNQDNKYRLQSNLEIQMLKEKLRSQIEENKSREARAAALHNLEYQILKEKLREAKAKADLAELYLRRQHYSDGGR